MSEGGESPEVPVPGSSQIPPPRGTLWNVSVAALAASWGFIAVIVAAVDLDAVVLVFFRLALAALTVGVLVLAARRLDLLRVPARRGWLVALGVALGGHWILYFLTIKLSSVAVAVLTVYTAPLFLALAAPLLLPESRSRVVLLALVPATAGIVLIALAGGEDGTVRPLALLTGLSAGATYAALVIATKRLRAGLHPATIAFWTYGVASLAVAPLLLAADRVVPSGAGEALGVLVLGVVFTGVSGLAYVTLLGHVTAQAAGLLAFVEPVSAALLAWAILDEPLTPVIVVGGALVLAAGVFVVVREPADAAAVEAPPGAPS